MVSSLRHARKVPEPDLGPFSGVDEGLCRLKAIIMSGGPRDERGSFLLAAGVSSATAENGHAGIVGGEDR
jgi:hypothetical protein